MADGWVRDLFFFTTLTSWSFFLWLFVFLYGSPALGRSASGLKYGHATWCMLLLYVSTRILFFSRDLTSDGCDKWGRVGHRGSQDAVMIPSTHVPHSQRRPHQHWSHPSSSLLLELYDLYPRCRSGTYITLNKIPWVHPFRNHIGQRSPRVLQGLGTLKLGDLA